MNMKLHELFGSYGSKNKSEAPEFAIYYDFKPHDSEEPILFALGMYSLDLD